MSADELRELARTLSGIADGQPWQAKDNDDNWKDGHPSRDPLEFVGRIRLKPWELGRTVNGHALPPGASWHRQDFTEDMLPDGYRPLMLGEKRSLSDSLMASDGIWIPCLSETSEYAARHRTTRPIPFTLTPAQIADGWLPWSGGECPVEPESRPTVMLRDGKTESGVPARTWIWERLDGESYAIVAYKPDPYGKFRQALAEGKTIQIKGIDGEWMDWGNPGFGASPDRYRIKEPQWLPLCDDDIPPGSVIRLIEPRSRTPWLPVYPMNSGVDIPNNGKWQFLSFDDMFTSWEINRPRHRDADGNPTLWEECRKQAP